MHMHSPLSWHQLSHDAKRICRVSDGIHVTPAQCLTTQIMNTFFGLSRMNYQRFVMSHCSPDLASKHLWQDEAEHGVVLFQTLMVSDTYLSLLLGI